jgi:hypothetical protein
VYWQTPLLGNRFSYDIDVSNVGCHCNAAAYFSQLPGHNSNQQPEAGPGNKFYSHYIILSDHFKKVFLKNLIFLHRWGLLL